MWRPQSRYTVSRIECRIKFPQDQRCRAKIALHNPKIKVSHLSPNPPVAFSLIRSRQGVRWAGGGYRGTFGFRKRIALQGGIAATVTPVALLCTTKDLLHFMQRGNHCGLQQKKKKTLGTFRQPRRCQPNFRG